MANRIIKYLDSIIYWSIIAIPFFMAISPAPMNLFMGLLIVAFLLKKTIKKEPLFTKTAINLPLLSLFLITCVSIINSVSFQDTIKGGILRLLQYILVIYSMIEGIKDKKQIKRIILSLTLGLVLTSFDEIWQVMTGHDFIRGYAPVINIGLIRATASFKDSNTLGIYLSAIAPLILGLTFFYVKGKKKTAMLFLSAISLAGVLLTYSRPTLLAVYVALFFLGIAKKNNKLVSLLVILALISPIVAPKSVKDWAKQVEYNPLRFMCNDDRIAVYIHSLNMIKAHPLIGVGANAFMKSYKKYKTFPEYHGIITPDYMYAHNMYLHMAGEIGLIGMGIFAWFLFALFKSCKGIYKKLEDNFLKIVSLSLYAGLIAFLVNGLTESSLYSSRVALIFWYIAGFSLALKKFTQKSI